MRAHHIHIKASTFRCMPAIIFALECKLNFHTSDVQMMLITGSKGGARCFLFPFFSLCPLLPTLSSLLHLPSFLPLFIQSSFFCSSFPLCPPLISFLLPPSLLPPPRPLSVFSSADGAPQWQAAEAVTTATRGGVCGCGSILSVVWRGGCKWILHTIACCSLVSGWRGADNQILNSEDAELLLCHHIEKAVCIFSLNSLHYNLGLHIFRLCHHNNMK